MKTLRHLLLFSILIISCHTKAQKAADELRIVMETHTTSGDLPGVVYIIADKENILDVQSLGLYDIANKKKMSPDVLFWIASQSKPLAGTAVMMLVEEGKLDLDEPITTYLPELNNMMIRRLQRDNFEVLEKAVKPITLRHLLSHTSGMTFLAGVQTQTGKIDILPLNNSVFVSAMTPLSFEPGEGEQYSNQGINIAGAIIEQVTGMKYETFLQQRLFTPLGMKSATFFPEGRQLANLVVPYGIKDGAMQQIPIHFLQYPLDDRSKRHAEAGGGIFCTPADLLKFYQMIASKGTYKGKRYLTENSVAMMSEPQKNIYEKCGKGLAWNANELYIGHGGAYGTDTKIYKKEGLIVMYFVMGDLPNQNEIFNQFEQKVREIYIAPHS